MKNEAIYFNQLTFISKSISISKIPYTTNVIIPVMNNTKADQDNFDKNSIVSIFK